MDPAVILQQRWGDTVGKYGRSRCTNKPQMSENKTLGLQHGEISGIPLGAQYRYRSGDWLHYAELRSVSCFYSIFVWPAVQCIHIDFGIEFPERLGVRAWVFMFLSWLMRSIRGSYQTLELVSYQWWELGKEEPEVTPTSPPVPQIVIVFRHSLFVSALLGETRLPWNEIPSTCQLLFIRPIDDP